MDISGATWHNDKPEYGFMLTETGYSDSGRPIYEYHADAEHPMTLQTSPACFVRPDRHGFTDLGSIPRFARWIIPVALHPASFILHDSPCRVGENHQLYFASKIEGPYRECSISYGSAAKLLGKGLAAAGFPKRARIAYHLVKRYGPKW